MVDLDRLFGALRDLVRQLTRHTDYHAAYFAEVKGQNDDGSLELTPLHPRLKGLSRVPLLGLPGVKAEVAQGARVLLGFWHQKGQPPQPYAALFVPDSLLSVTITASAEVKVVSPSVVCAPAGAQTFPVALVGDTVQVTGVCGPPGTPLLLTGYISGGKVVALKAG